MERGHREGVASEETRSIGHACFNYRSFTRREQHDLIQNWNQRGSRSRYCVARYVGEKMAMEARNPLK